MCFGSEDRERTFRQGECRTTDDVGRLFERYRAEARHYAEVPDPDAPAEPEREPEDAPVLTTR
jgi:hypothetical protein